MFLIKADGSFNKALFHFLAILLSLFAALILFFSLPWGVGIAPDSVEYIKAADRFVKSPEFHDLPSHWPPLYPLFLSLLFSIFDSHIYAALMGQVFLFAINAYLYFLLFLSAIQANSARSYVLALFGVTFFISSSNIFNIQQFALSEALFLALLMSSVLWLIRGIKSNNSGLLFLSAVLVGLALITRYAAIVFCFVFTLYVLAFSYKKQKTVMRLTVAFLYIITSLLPLITWLVLNHLVRGEGTNRDLIFDPSSQEKLHDLLKVFLQWFSSGAIGLVSWLAMISVIAIILYGVFLGRFKESTRLMIVSLLFAGVSYIAFIFISLTFFDAYTLVDQRIMLPAWLFFFLALFSAMDAVFNSIENYNHRGLAVFMLLVFVFVYISTSSKTLRIYDISTRMGVGYLRKGAGESELLGLVKKEADKKIIYTNAQDLVYIYTGLELENLPAFFSPVHNSDNNNFIPEMLQLIEQVDQGEAAVAYFNSLAWRTYHPDVTNLTRDFSLRSDYHLDDGYYFHRWAGAGDKAPVPMKD